MVLSTEPFDFATSYQRHFPGSGKVPRRTTPPGTNITWRLPRKTMLPWWRSQSTGSDYFVCLRLTRSGRFSFTAVRLNTKFVLCGGIFQPARFFDSPGGTFILIMEVMMITQSISSYGGVIIRGIRPPGELSYQKVVIAGESSCGRDVLRGSCPPGEPSMHRTYCPPMRFVPIQTSCKARGHRCLKKLCPPGESFHGGVVLTGELSGGSQSPGDWCYNTHFP